MPFLIPYAERLMKKRPLDLMIALVILVMLLMDMIIYSEEEDFRLFLSCLRHDTAFFWQNSEPGQRVLHVHDMPVPFPFSKSPPCKTKPFTTLWKVLPLYPYPFSPVATQTGESDLSEKRLKLTINSEL